MEYVGIDVHKNQIELDKMGHFREGNAHGLSLVLDRRCRMG